jgi:hypothetical protein
MTIYDASELENYVDNILLLNVDHIVYFDKLNSLLIKDGKIYFLDKPHSPNGEIYWNRLKITRMNLGAWFNFPIKTITKEELHAAFF